jgi:hypothetical protein
MPGFLKCINDEEENRSCISKGHVGKVFRWVFDHSEVFVDFKDNICLTRNFIPASAGDYDVRPASTYGQQTGADDERYVKCPDGSVRQIIGFDTDINRLFVWINGAKCFVDGKDYQFVTIEEYLADCQIRK